VAELLQMRVASVDVAARSTQRDDVTFPVVVGYKNADVREMLTNLADTRSLRSDDQTMQALLNHYVARLLILLQTTLIYGTHICIYVVLVICLGLNRHI